jgi:hypothetical protein
VWLPGVAGDCVVECVVDVVAVFADVDQERRPSGQDGESAGLGGQRIESSDLRKSNPAPLSASALAERPG